MKNNVEPLPVNVHKSIAKRLENLYVPCMISGRYLEFPAQSGGHFKGGEFIPISVMTVGNDNQPRKICELVLTREQLLAALAACKQPAGK